MLDPIVPEFLKTIKEEEITINYLWERIFIPRASTTAVATRPFFPCLKIRTRNWTVYLHNVLSRQLSNF